MRPGDIWPLMNSAGGLVMRASLHLGEQASLVCLRGGDAGNGEIALRVPAEVDLRALTADWEGLKVTLLADGGQPGQHLLRIAPADEGYRDLYVHLADDLHDHLEQVTQAQEAAKVLLSRLRLWAGFLRLGEKSLDARTIRGLFTELKALEQVLVPAFGWEAALSAWSGPGGLAQDVITDRLAMDVKTSAQDDTIVTISSIEQLDPTGNRTVRLLEGMVSEGHGETLASLVSRLNASAGAAGCAPLFLARLRQMQITPNGIQDTDGQPMTLDLWRVHRVDDPGFPRLTRAGVPAGLVSASYRIDLARSTAAQGSLEEITELLNPVMASPATGGLQ